MVKLQAYEHVTALPSNGMAVLKGCKMRSIFTFNGEGASVFAVCPACSLRRKTTWFAALETLHSRHLCLGPGAGVFNVSVFEGSMSH